MSNEIIIQFSNNLTEQFKHIPANCDINTSIYRRSVDKCSIYDSLRKMFVCARRHQGQDRKVNNIQYRQEKDFLRNENTMYCRVFDSANVHIINRISMT